MKGATVLTLGSCLDPVSGLASLPRWAVDHTICDPPYEGEVHTKGRRLRSGTFRDEQDGSRRVVVTPIAYAPMTAWERIEVSREIARVTRRWILVFCQAEAAHLWRWCLEAAGAEYVRTGVWWKTDGQPQLTGDRPGQGWEAVVICHGARAMGDRALDLSRDERQWVGRMRWNGGGHCGRWGYCARWAGSSRQTGGNLRARKLIDGQKPEWLMRRLVKQFSDPGELICDPYTGSGSTGVAALKLGRRFLGWEVSPKHHEIADVRLSQTLRALQEGR